MKLLFPFATWVCILMILFGVIIMCDCENVKFYRINFTTATATKSSYMKFIKDIRNAAILANHTAGPLQINGVPVLHQNTSIDDDQRFIEVFISNLNGNNATIAIDLSDLYVVGYRTLQRSFFLAEVPSGTADLFPNTTRRDLTFTGSYGDLQRAAGGVNRATIPLGIEELGSAIDLLYYSNDFQTTAKALIVIIQMISEAARFRPIEQLVRATINEEGPRPVYTCFTPSPYMMSLETNWGQLSTQVQAATSQTESFGHAVLLNDEQGEPFTINTVRQILFSLAIMKLICKNRQYSQLPELLLTHVPTRSMVRDAICPYTEEPTVFIQGRYGFCLAVIDDKYSDGSRVSTFGCKKNRVNQQWTFPLDGTIRSNGKCLTTYGYTPGDHIMIYDCEKAVSGATKWKLWSDGTIINLESGLVLNDPWIENTLTVQVSNFASSQGWSVTFDNVVPHRYIVGLNDLCLYTDGSESVWLIDCAYKDTTIWKPYTDGTIRPYSDPNLCINGRESDNLVLLSSCTGLPNERWIFENDGSIKLLYNNLVMGVKNSDPKLRTIITSTFTGDANQIWFLRNA